MVILWSAQQDKLGLHDRFYKREQVVQVTFSQDLHEQTTLLGGEDHLDLS